MNFGPKILNRKEEKHNTIVVWEYVTPKEINNNFHKRVCEIFKGTDQRNINRDDELTYNGEKYAISIVSIVRWALPRF